MGGATGSGRSFGGSSPSLDQQTIISTGTHGSDDIDSLGSANAAHPILASSFTKLLIIASATPMPCRVPIPKAGGHKAGHTHWNVEDAKEL